MRFSSLPVFASLPLLLVACGPREVPPPAHTQAAGFAMHAVSLEVAQGTLLVAVLADTQAETAEQTAVNIAASTARFTPAGCATATTDGASVTMRFHACDGPRGLEGVSGALGISLEVNATTIDAQVRSDPYLDPPSAWPAMVIGDVDVQIYAEAVVRTGTMTVSGGMGDVTLPVDGTYTMTWDDHCRTLSGGFDMSSDYPEAVWRTHLDVTNLETCERSCPQSGTASALDLGELTVTYDGTATPSWQSVDGQRGTATATCTPK